MRSPFTQYLLIANVLVFFIQGYPGVIEQFALWPGAGTGLASLPLLAPWQLVTYSFLHGNLTHLAFNMFAVWMFGGELERVWGPRRLAVAYFASVVTAAVTQLIVGGMFSAGGAPVVGASGGVFGLLLAYALVFPNRVIMPLFPPIPMPARVFVLVYALIELLLGVTGTQSGVAHFAHLGGLIGGWAAWRYGRSTLAKFR